MFCALAIGASAQTLGSNPPKTGTFYMLSDTKNGIAPPYPGGRKVMFTGRPVLVLGGRHVTFDVVDGLEKGKTYTFDVAAVNEAGEGPARSTKPITVAATDAAE